MPKLRMQQIIDNSIIITKSIINNNNSNSNSNSNSNNKKSLRHEQENGGNGARFIETDGKSVAATIQQSVYHHVSWTRLWKRI
mmetsp:Transcript_20010/g.20343  ORF Transcript_20010/g.20343 Transcript_20010/m.20343 type:complete len:83 (+) Transcript_20010:287-535(+)